VIHGESAHAAWTPLPLVAGTGGVHALTDPIATGAQRYYRVRQWCAWKSEIRN